MKKQLALSLTFFCSFWVMAQDQISWSPPVTEYSSRVRDILFFKDHGYVLRAKGDAFSPSKMAKIILQQLDSRLNYTKELDIKLKYEGNQAEPHKMIVLNDKLYLLYTGYGDRQKKLLLSEIDPETLNFLGEPIILSAVKTSSQILVEQSKNGRFFSVLAYWEGKDNSKAYVRCYDNNFQLLYEDLKDIDLEFKRNKCSQLVVDDEGNTFAIIEESFVLPMNSPVFWQKYKSGESIISPVKDENDRYRVGKARVLLVEEVVLLAGYYTQEEFKKDGTKGIAFMAYNKGDKGNSKKADVLLPTDISKYTDHLTYDRGRNSEEMLGLTTIGMEDWDGHGYLVVGERRCAYPKSEDDYAVDAVAFVSLVDYSLSKVHWTIPVCKYFSSTDKSNGLYLILDKKNVNVFFNSNDYTNKQHHAPLYGNGFIQMTIKPDGAHSTQVFYERTEGLDIYPKLIKPIDGKSWLVIAGQSFGKEKLGIIRP